MISRFKYVFHLQLEMGWGSHPPKNIPVLWVQRLFIFVHSWLVFLMNPSQKMWVISAKYVQAWLKNNKTFENHLALFDEELEHTTLWQSNGRNGTSTD